MKECYEYSIYCIYGEGEPFYQNTFKTLQAAKRKLKEMIDLEEKRNRPYFVDNDFFENKYPAKISRAKYFSIHKRKVSKWEKYTEDKKDKNNIIYFYNICN